MNSLPGESGSAQRPVRRTPGLAHLIIPSGVSSLESARGQVRLSRDSCGNSKVTLIGQAPYYRHTRPLPFSSFPLSSLCLSCSYYTVMSLSVMLYRYAYCIATYVCSIRTVPLWRYSYAVSLSLSVTRSVIALSCCYIVICTVSLCLFCPYRLICPRPL